MTGDLHAFVDLQDFVLRDSVMWHIGEGPAVPDALFAILKREGADAHYLAALPEQTGVKIEGSL